jgi:large subunit ribosomal protein L22
MGRTYEETGLVRAHAKWVRTSARKARIVLEHVRGLPVADARVQLRFATRHAADDILRVLDSAVANAVNNHGLEEESLVVAEAFADEGVTMKRWQPRARGRAMRIRKRTAHITILLRSIEPAEPAEAEKPKRRSRKAADTPAAAAPAPAKGRKAAKAAEDAPAADEAVDETPSAEAVRPTRRLRPRPRRPRRPLRPRPRWPSRRRPRRRRRRRPPRRRPRRRRSRSRSARAARRRHDSDPEGEEA